MEDKFHKYLLNTKTPSLEQKVSKQQAPVNWKIVLERYHSMLAL